MPLVYDEALWRALYNEPSKPGVTSYDREFYGNQTMFTDRRGWIQNAGATANRSILVVGCAYGFLIEKLLDAGFTDTWGIDPSPWVWQTTGEMRGDVRSRVANGEVGSGNEANALALIGAPSSFFYVVDEDAASSHSDAELPAFFSACEDLLQGGAKGRIIHVVTTGDGTGDSAINWKSIEEWHGWAPDHTWVEAQTGQVI